MSKLKFGIFYLTGIGDYFFPIVAETEQYNREEFCAKLERLISDGYIPYLSYLHKMLKNLRERRK